MWGPLFMDYKEVFLGARSILRGSGALYFLIPEKWVAMPTYISPEAYVLKVIGDYAWIMVGNVSMPLIKRDLWPLVREAIPLFPTEIVGIDMMAKVADAIVNWKPQS